MVPDGFDFSFSHTMMPSFFCHCQCTTLNRQKCFQTVDRAWGVEYLEASGTPKKNGDSQGAIGCWKNSPQNCIRVQWVQCRPVEKLDNHLLHFVQMTDMWFEFVQAIIICSSVISFDGLEVADCYLQTFCLSLLNCRDPFIARLICTSISKTACQVMALSIPFGVSRWSSSTECWDGNNNNNRHVEVQVMRSTASDATAKNLRC